MDSSKQRLELWTTENYDDIIKMGYHTKRSLYSKESPFQQIDVVETTGLGKMLLNDGLVMVTERDEFVYHEMITHVPMSVHPNPKKALIIGGGDGGTSRELLKYPSIEKVVMVEIDPCVIEAAREHLTTMSCEFDNPKLELRIEDGLKYVKETAERFDVVIVDSTDPIGPAAPLFGSEFYTDIFNCMSDNGVVISQGESPFFHLEVQASMLEMLSGIFSKVKIYNYNNLTYPGGMWSFTYASKGLDPILDQRKIPDEIRNNLKFYNHGLHKASFCLPNFQHDRLKEYFK